MIRKFYSSFDEIVITFEYVFNSLKHILIHPVFCIFDSFLFQN